MKREHVEFGLIGDGNLLLERLIFALEWRATSLFVRELKREGKRLRQEEREEWEARPFVERLPKVKQGPQPMFAHYGYGTAARNRMICDELIRRNKVTGRPIVYKERPGYSHCFELAREIGLSGGTIGNIWQDNKPD